MQVQVVPEVGHFEAEFAALEAEFEAVMQEVYYLHSEEIAVD